VNLVRAVQRFRASRTGKVVAWITVAALVSVALRAFVLLGLRVAAAQSLGLSDAVLLGLGLFAARAAWLVHMALIRSVPRSGSSHA
jgi:hypothetical protein